MKKVVMILLVLTLPTLMTSVFTAAVRAGSGTRRTKLQVAPESANVPAGTAGVDLRPITRFISIPFGFDGPLLLDNSSREAQVIGHGGCTEGAPVTVMITLTQTSTTALATGQAEEECQGELQLWGATAVISGEKTFAADPALACGLALLHDGDEIADSFEWCKTVDLIHGNFLPLIMDAH